MADLALQFGGDLWVSPTGDIAVVDGPQATQQRVLRRLLTNASDYIWQLTYGAGLGQFVGEPGAPAAITGIVRSQLLLENTVALNPTPVVSTDVAVDGTVTLTLQYADSANNQTSSLSFSL